jgi:hypothetical protein
MALLGSTNRRLVTRDGITLRAARYFVLLSLQFLLSGSASFAQPIQAPEPEVKAAFLYNFTKLVTWPQEAFTNKSAPLVIGVLGKDPFGKQLDDMLAGRSVGSRKVIAVRFKPTDALTNCHVLFISESERRRLDFIFAELRGKPILTVGDSRGFAEQGMIELVKTNGTINLNINLTAANRAGLSLSSHLTRLDRTLRPAPGTNAPPRSLPELR